MRVATAIVFVVLLATEVTDADVAACKSDVFRFCKSSIPLYPFDGGSHVIQCLETNRLQLAPACQKTLRKHGI